MKTKMKKRTIKIIIGIAVTILAAVALLLFLPKNISGTDVTVSRGSISTYYSFSGSIEAKNHEIVYAEQIMQIKSIKVAAGDLVAEGDTLYTTKSGNSVKASIDGEVLDVYVSENEQVIAGTKVMEIVDYSALELSVNVDEYDLAGITEGMNANVTIHALSKDITGTVSKVSKVGTYENGVTFFTAIITIPQDGSIKIGMSAEAKVMNKSVTDVLTLPMSAIQFDSSDNPFVYIKTNGKLSTVDVTLGVTDGTAVEIVSGLNENDTVFVPSVAVDYSSMRNDQSANPLSGE